MSKGKARIRLSPNEEARLLKDEREKRRKLRIVQVRQLAKVNAANARAAVKQEETKQIQLLGKQLEDEWQKEKAERLARIQESYERILNHVGESHQEAVTANIDQVAYEKQKKQQQNADYASVRHQAAMKREKQARNTQAEQANKHILARQQALDVERERAAHIASLPPVPPDPIADLPTTSAVRPVRVTDMAALSTTHYHIPDSCVVEIANEVERSSDARQSAQEQGQIIADIEAEEKRSSYEQREKARLRGKHALEKEMLKRDYSDLLHDLSDLQRADMNRRRQVVAKIPKQIYQLPFQHLQEKQETQCTMERAFEDMYLSATDRMGDLSLALDPHPAPASPEQSEVLDLSDVSQLDETLTERDQPDHGVTTQLSPHQAKSVSRVSPNAQRQAPHTASGLDRDAQPTGILTDRTNKLSPQPHGSKPFFTRRPAPGLNKLLSRIRTQRGEPPTTAVDQRSDISEPASSSISQHPLSANDTMSSEVSSDPSSGLSAADETMNTVIQIPTSSPHKQQCTVIDDDSDVTPVASPTRGSPPKTSRDDENPTRNGTLLHPVEQAESIRRGGAFGVVGLKGLQKPVLTLQQQLLEQQKLRMEQQKYQHEEYKQQQELRQQQLGMEERQQQELEALLERNRLQAVSVSPHKSTTSLGTDSGPYTTTSSNGTSQGNVQLAQELIKQQLELKEKIAAIEKQKELLRYRSALEASPAQQVPVVSQASDSSGGSRDHSVTSGEDESAVHSHKQVQESSEGRSDGYTAKPDISTLLDDSTASRVREYQQKLLERQLSGYRSLDESRADLDRRRREIMMKYAPQHVDTGLDTSVAMRRPSSEDKSASAGDLCTSGSVIPSQDATQIELSESDTSKDSQHGQSDSGNKSKRQKFLTDALLKILQKDKEPREMDMFQDVSSVMTPSECSHMVTESRQLFDSASNGAGTGTVIYSGGSVSGDSIRTNTGGTSDESLHVTLPKTVLPTSDTPKPASLLEHILQNADLTSSSRNDSLVSDDVVNGALFGLSNAELARTTLQSTPKAQQSNVQVSSSDASSFFNSHSDSDYEQRQMDLEQQLMKIRAEKAEILERQNQHKQDLAALHERMSADASGSDKLDASISSNGHSNSNMSDVVQVPSSGESFMALQQDSKASLPDSSYDGLSIPSISTFAPLLIPSPPPLPTTWTTQPNANSNASLVHQPSRVQQLSRYLSTLLEKEETVDDTHDVQDSVYEPHTSGITITSPPSDRQLPASSFMLNLSADSSDLSPQHQCTTDRESPESIHPVLQLSESTNTSKDTPRLQQQSVPTTGATAISDQMKNLHNSLSQDAKSGDEQLKTSGPVLPDFYLADMNTLSTMRTVSPSVSSGEQSDAEQHQHSTSQSGTTSTLQQAAEEEAKDHLGSLLNYSAAGFQSISDELKLRFSSSGFSTLKPSESPVSDIENKDEPPLIDLTASHISQHPLKDTTNCSLQSDSEVSNATGSDTSADSKDNVLVLDDLISEPTGSTKHDSNRHRNTNDITDCDVSQYDVQHREHQQQQDISSASSDSYQKSAQQHILDFLGANNISQHPLTSPEHASSGSSTSTLSPLQQQQQPSAILTQPPPPPPLPHVHRDLLVTAHAPPSTEKPRTVQDSWTHLSAQAAGALQAVSFSPMTLTDDLLTGESLTTPMSTLDQVSPQSLTNLAITNAAALDVQLHSPLHFTALQPQLAMDVSSPAIERTSSHYHSSPKDANMSPFGLSRSLGCSTIHETTQSEAGIAEEPDLTLLSITSTEDQVHFSSPPRASASSDNYSTATTISQPPSELLRTQLNPMALLNPLHSKPDDDNIDEEQIKRTTQTVDPVSFDHDLSSDPISVEGNSSGTASVPDKQVTLGAEYVMPSADVEDSRELTLDPSLLSFERHEASTAGSSSADVSGELLVGAVGGESVTASIGTGSEDGVLGEVDTTDGSNTIDQQNKTNEHGASLQEAFKSKQSDFMKRCEARQKQTKAKQKSSQQPAGGNPLSGTLATWKRNRALQHQPKSAVSGGSTSLSSDDASLVVVDKSATDRMIDDKHMKERTERLYNQLEEVKQQKLLQDRKQQYAQNRQRAKEYQKKLQERKLKKKSK